MVSLDEALELARQAGVDLVEVNPKAEPPICRLRDTAAMEKKAAAMESAPPVASYTVPRLEPSDAKSALMTPTKAPTSACSAARRSPASSARSS